LRRDIGEASQSLALEFMRFATETSSQQLLMNQAGIIPTNANVNGSTTNEQTGNTTRTSDRSEIDGAPFITVLIEQAQSGYVLPSAIWWQPLVELGSGAYTAVLEDNRDPNTVVAELTRALNAANGIVVTPTPTPQTPSADVLREEAGDGEDEAGADGEPTPAPTAATAEEP
jgi:maltose-binding protein MalE